VLKREGFRVLRFWNRAVRLRLGEVMNAIVLALEAEPPLPTRLRLRRIHPPHEGEGKRDSYFLTITIGSWVSFCRK